MTLHKKLEDEAMDAIRAVLMDYAQPLQDRGLECVLYPLKRENCGAANYSSEGMIYFKKDKDIVDILEFHLVRNGRALVTVREVEAWMRQEMGGIAGD